MAEHNVLGKAGEEAAVQFLENHGYVIRHRNWRMRHFELDIVAAKENLLIVVEVKTRTDTDFGNPEEAVNWKKIRNTVRAANAYIQHFGIDEQVRFDIISVVGSNGNFQINHLQEAFLPPVF